MIKILLVLPMLPFSLKMKTTTTMILVMNCTYAGQPHQEEEIHQEEIHLEADTQLEETIHHQEEEIHLEANTHLEEVNLE